MTSKMRPALMFAALCLTACGGSPTNPSSSSSFLASTWRGTLTIQQNPNAAGAPPATSGPVTCTFEVVPDTNLQTVRATVRSEHDWLPITFLGTTAIIPGNTPPAQIISTQGDYSSPRGCRGTCGSFGTAEATRIDADFTGVDCSVSFTGRVVLTKS